MRERRHDLRQCLLERMGIDTGLELDALTGIVPWIEERLGKRVPGLLSKAGAFPR